jgi:ketosteroid isomerase-like protein
MASANLDLVRSICDAWERGDYSSAEWADPEIEFVITGRGPADGSWRGLASVRKALREYMSIWENMRPEVEEFRELDGERIIAMSSPRGRGKGSGVELGQMAIKEAQLFHVRDGKVTKIVHYGDRGRGLAELGLAPTPDSQ